jgi:hypothetical protein
VCMRERYIERNIQLGVCIVNIYSFYLSQAYGGIWATCKANINNHQLHVTVKSVEKVCRRPENLFLKVIALWTLCPTGKDSLNTFCLTDDFTNNAR